MMNLSTWERHTLAKLMYDIFFVSQQEVNETAWNEFKQRFPNAQKVSNCTYNILKEKSFTKMFWVIWDDLDVSSSFDLTKYQATKWDDFYIHVFLNNDSYDGICLFPKNTSISNREFKSRFFVNKKPVDIVASTPKKQNYDIIFISYKEKFAEKNYHNLLKKAPHAKWVKDIKGIHQAHIEAAKVATTEMFWIVDADAIIEADFNFDYYVPVYERQHVHVWRSRNPINDLEYGYGGVKLFPTELTLNMNVNTTDMTTSISKHFKAMPQVSNMTAFNSDPFNTWKSAFRECVKLSSKIIDRQNEEETNKRLETWTTVGHDREFGEYALAGAKDGMEFGLSDGADLRLINDFKWLEDRFNAR